QLRFSRRDTNRKHQLKIYEPNKAVGPPTNEEEISGRVRAHPYREEGGLFIFPSIHVVLSKYKNKGPTTKAAPVPSPIASLNDLLKGGFPRGRCVGLIGDRGAHKSHLGYLQVLSGVMNRASRHREKALVI